MESLTYLTLDHDVRQLPISDMECARVPDRRPHARLVTTGLRRGAQDLERDRRSPPCPDRTLPATEADVQAAVRFAAATAC